jgi:hypothetical protein
VRATITYRPGRERSFTRRHVIFTDCAQSFEVPMLINVLPSRE